MTMKKPLKTALVALILLTIALLGPAGALADDTGWKDPSADAAFSGGGLDNPDNAYADDAAFADKCFDTGGTAQHLYYDYNLVVDPCATIDGIEVILDWWLDTDIGDSTMSVELSWDGGTSWTAAKTDTVRTTTEHRATLGGATDTWGRTWTADELSNDNFRVRVTVYDTDT